MGLYMGVHICVTKIKAEHDRPLAQLVERQRRQALSPQ